MHDIVTIGGGLMGSVTSWHLAQAGLDVALVERRGLGMGASGVNAGTLSIQIKRAALIPYALKGWELWRSTSERFGIDIGFRQTGGLTLAFTDEEAEMLEARMTAKRDAGCPIEFLDKKRIRELEPNLSEAPILASYCPLDGYADSTATGRVYRRALRESGVTIAERFAVTRIERISQGFRVHAADGRTIEARRLLLAAGAWLGKLVQMLDVDLPIGFRVNMVSVTERAPRVLDRILGVASGLLTLKQSTNGTVLIGGGWQGKGSDTRGGYEILPDNLIGNLRLAAYAVPALRQTRIVRSWLGLEAHVPDLMPLAGPLPGVADAYILGCVRGGYTISPCIGHLMSQLILGQQPEMPLFDPSRQMQLEPGSQADPQGGFLHVESSSA